MEPSHSATATSSKESPALIDEDRTPTMDQPTTMTSSPTLPPRSSSSSSSSSARAAATTSATAASPKRAIVPLRERIRGVLGTKQDEASSPAPKDTSSIQARLQSLVETGPRSPSPSSSHSRSPLSSSHPSPERSPSQSSRSRGLATEDPRLSTKAGGERPRRRSHRTLSNGLQIDTENLHAPSGSTSTAASSLGPESLAGNRDERSGASTTDHGAPTPRPRRPRRHHTADVLGASLSASREADRSGHHRSPLHLRSHHHQHNPFGRRTNSPSSRRTSVPMERPRGSLPVAPSWHPHAPDELRVESPKDAVLLPFLSLSAAHNEAPAESGDRLSPKSTLPPLPASAPAAPTSPTSESGPSSAAAAAAGESTPTGAETRSKVKPQRPNIKVRVITWNHGSSVPKGDLEVLLGKVGEYIAPDEGWDISDDDDDDDEKEDKEGAAGDRKHRGKGVAGQEEVPRQDRIPPLPFDDAHPYHIVVVAGQECPWGDGKRIATGVGLAGELGDLGRSKSRAAQLAKEKKDAKDKIEEKEREKDKEKEKEKEREKEKEKGKEAGKEADKDKDKKANGSKGDDSTEYPFHAPALVDGGHSVPGTPGLGVALPSAGGRALGGRGWSDMCEDWLCRGPIAQATATKGMASASFVTSSRGASHAATPEDGSSPMISRATSPSGFDGKKKANGLPLLHLSIEQDGSTTPQLALSPLSASVAKDAGPTLSSPVGSGPAEKVEAMRSKRHTLSVPALRLPRSASFVSVVNKSKGDRQIPSSPIEGVSDAEDAALTDVSRPESPMPGPVARHVNGGSPLPSDQEGMPPGSMPDSYFHQRPTNQPHPPGQHRPRPVHKLALHIPGLSGAHHVSVQADGTPLSLGAYELVAKERCYMMYLAIYVWRGCLDRVKGTSHGTVKSGLLAGRVGNKGAVGISMKLGHTRLLFVNAHLAAHDFRVAERIANVHKIKKELKVDTFLPPEDERNKDDDLTACFDHAFWFGDLNFRVDIDRRHADWLLMNKEYDKALKFDQLKRIMAEEPDVFRGFQEAPIHFPPTFKYDVLKTIKIKKEEKLMQKRLRAPTLASTTSSNGKDSRQIQIREGSSEQRKTPSSEAFVLGSPSGEFVHSPGQNKRHTKKATSNNGSPSKRGSKRATTLEKDDDASSISSSNWANSSTGGLTDAEVENLTASSINGGASGSSYDGCSPGGLGASSSMDAVVSSNTAAAEGHRMQGKMIKAKRKLFGIVQAVSGAAREREERGASHNHRLHQAVTSALGRDASALSFSSQQEQGSGHQRQRSEPIAIPGASRGVSVNGDREVGGHLVSASSYDNVPASASTSQLGRSVLPTDESQSSQLSPPRDSRHRRSSSAGASSPVRSESAANIVAAAIASATGPGGASTSSIKSKNGGGTSLSDMIIEFEKQPYDTSSKQRVPSWCDRVLWRSNVAVVENEEPRVERIVEGMSTKVGTVLRDAFSRASGNSFGTGSDGFVNNRHRSLVAPKSAAAGTTAGGASGSSPGAAVGPSVTFAEGLDGRLRSNKISMTQTSSPKNESPTAQTPVSASSPAKRWRFSKRREDKFKRSNTTLDSLGGPGGLSSTIEDPAKLGSRAGAMQKAVSAVDLPSQINERRRSMLAAEPDAPLQERRKGRPTIRPRRTSLQNQRKNAVTYRTTSTESAASAPAVPLQGDGDKQMRAAPHLRLPSLPVFSALTATSSPASTASPAAEASAQSPPGMARSASYKIDDSRRHASQGSTTNQAAPHSSPGPRSSWWADHLPNFLTNPAASLANFTFRSRKQDSLLLSTSEHKGDEELIGPKRGEVQCLMYKSLDDREMRLLEGRSDHRPVIFVASIGV